MKGNQLGGSINIDLEKLAKKVNIAIPLLMFLFGALTCFSSVYFIFPAVLFFYLFVLNIYYLYVQKHHTLLSNFGVVAQVRYILESVGPEFRQYFFSSDQEERPFNRVQRTEVYKKAKGGSFTSSFGSQKDYLKNEIKLKHSMFPTKKEDLKPFSLTIGEERGLQKAYTLTNPYMIYSMSYGSLGKIAIRALSRGARNSKILMNTGEGGFPKYHLMEGADLIFQIGTGKFGARNEDASLNKEKLKEISKLEKVKMIEVKLSQGAKPGKGGILPKEKIDKEISELRGVPMGEDVISPASHVECHDAKTTVSFIKSVQNTVDIPVGIKLCIGREDDFVKLVSEMKEQNTFPDFITVDGAEGGTGAAPKTFMDDIGVPIHEALPFVHKTLKDFGVRDRLKLFASGKLISPGKHFIALAQGADAIYSARGFMLAIGCIQALQCNNNTCPVGITTHKKKLESGLDIETKAQRVKQYIDSINKEHKELLCSLGKKNFNELCEEDLHVIS